MADDTSLGDVVSHADDLAHGIAGDIRTHVMSRQAAREIAMSIIAMMGDMELLGAGVDDARMANALARAEALVLMLAEQD